MGRALGKRLLIAAAAGAVVELILIGPKAPHAFLFTFFFVLMAMQVRAMVREEIPAGVETVKWMSPVAAAFVLFVVVEWYQSGWEDALREFLVSSVFMVGIYCEEKWRYRREREQ